MKNFLIFLILVAVGYITYQAFDNSQAVRTESFTERTLRENDLQDLQSDIPTSSHEALRETKGDVDGFIETIQHTIDQWRIDINKWIDKRI